MQHGRGLPHPRTNVKTRYINPVNQQKILHTNPVVYPLGGEYVKKPRQMYRRARPKNVRMNRKYRTTQPGMQRAIKPMETPRVNKYTPKKKEGEKLAWPPM
jgi:hypothetical protein|tara:strand:- start:127 stop:429 length:303 start_codon:yes stop_codon:yes gene_type:complete